MTDLPDEIEHPFLKDRNLSFRKRVGPDPHEDGARTPALNDCPDIWETESGDFAVIGIRITEKARQSLPESAGCGPDEEIVLLPRNLLVGAKSHIPD